MSHITYIGDTCTLSIHSESTTHQGLEAKQQLNADMFPDVVRMSVDIEYINNILCDVDQALSA